MNHGRYFTSIFRDFSPLVWTRFFRRKSRNRENFHRTTKPEILLEIIFQLRQISFAFLRRRCSCFVDETENPRYKAAINFRPLVISFHLIDGGLVATNWRRRQTVRDFSIENKTFERLWHWNASTRPRNRRIWIRRNEKLFSSGIGHEFSCEWKRAEMKQFSEGRENLVLLLRKPFYRHLTSAGNGMFLWELNKWLSQTFAIGKFISQRFKNIWLCVLIEIICR